MTTRSRTLVAALALLLAVPAAPALAASDGLSRSVWIPYWKDEAGIEEIQDRLGDFDSVSPFVFEVDSKGAIHDRAGLRSAPWKEFLADAEREGVKVYPTVSWFRGQEIHDTLKSKSKRSKHVTKLVSAVVSKNKTVDGIEIDYESKLAETNPHFAKFLAELGKKLDAKKKDLICTVEARTPKADLYAPGSPQITAKPVYANDYAAINKACDVVRVMAYDQGRAVVSLNRANAGSGYYAPIADVAWVKKVMASTTSQIAPGKVVMGIPTYGRVYRIDPDGGYAQIASVTYKTAMELSAMHKAKPVRGVSGELGFSYTAPNSGLPGSVTPPGTMNRYYVTFADSVSAASATALAKQLGLGGIALFKADGESDPATWNKVLP